MQSSEQGTFFWQSQKNQKQKQHTHRQSNDQQQIFLRNDVLQLHENIMVSGNFNLRKISQSRQNESKKTSKGESVQIKLKKLINETKPTDISSGNDTKEISCSFMIPSQKNSTSIDWNKHYETKRGSLKTENLNKLLKKKDSFSFGIANKETVSMKGVRANIGMNSTYQSQKNDENIEDMNSTKYGMNRTQQKSIRSKIMSMTSKNITGHRFSTEISRQDENSLMKMKKAKRMQTQNVEKGSRINYKQKKNNYEQLEKKFNKGGPLKFKHVQNWLNNIIQEYCHQEYFDTSLTSAALKKYYIDSNSLMSNGVQPNDVNRIYSSLFVYSIGFNNLLKQISKGNKQLVKNIWKVYSLLLQYCAAGSYETVVAEIERDKLRKVEQLKLEIEKRQQIIEKNQQLNEQKNIHMYKELKRLKDENFNLANQREILMEDFQQADQAFNQEVSLRLKFENNINEIFGVHKQLENKHGRLFTDFQQKMEQLRKSSEKYFEQTKNAQKYKYELIELKQKHNELNKINQHDKQHISVLLVQLGQMKEKWFSTNKQLQQWKSILVQKDRKLQQMNSEFNNNKIILELREKSAKQTHAEYQITLEENNKLFAVISQQRQQMQALLKEKKEFNQNVLKILAESSYYKKKYQASQTLISELKQKILQTESSLHKMQVQKEIFQREIQNYKNDLDNNYESIRKMHQINFQLEEELNYLRKFQGNMDTLLQDKNILIQTLKSKIQSLQTKVMQQTHQFMNLQSRYKILESQLRAEKQMGTRRLQQFKKQQQLMSTNQTSLSKVLKQTTLQLERTKHFLNDTITNLKNEKFERNNLNLNYQQILKVLQKKNADLKQAAIRINQLQEEVILYKEKYKMTHLNLLNTTDEMNHKISQLNHKITHQQEVLDYKAHHQHPMLYEDIFHQLERQIASHQKTKQQTDNIIQQKNTQITSLQQEIQHLKSQFKQQIDKKQKESSSKQDKLKSQIDYQKQLNIKLSQRLSALQILQKTYKQKVSIYEQKQADQKRQQQLINEIQSKNTQIASLNQQIQQITSSNQQQILNLQKKIKQVENEKLDFVYEFKTKKERQIRQQMDQKYLKQIQTLKDNFQQQLKNNKFKYSPRFTQFTPGSPQEQQFKNYFKLILKTQPLDQILEIKKQQLQQMNEQQIKIFHQQVSHFFKNSINHQENDLSARPHLFSISKNSTEKDFIKSLYKTPNSNLPSYLQKMQQTSEDFKKRNSIAKKLKNAYEYYGKI